MRENVYNLFLYVERDVVVELGVVAHGMEGTDEEKTTLSRSHVPSDFVQAQRFQLRRAVEWREYQGMMRLGRHLELFEPALASVGAQEHPLVVVTPIVNGAPRIDAVTGLGPLDLNEVRDHQTPSGNLMPDYLSVFTHGQHFDFAQLFDDDFFRAIRLLYNAGHYVSAAKLLMSFLDTVAYIEYGDRPGNFIPWLTEYASLAALGITPEELWEFRNGLLHMTNLDSRKVRKGDVARLIMQFGGENLGPLPTPPATKYFGLMNLSICLPA
jgi:hypothetical protein